MKDETLERQLENLRQTVDETFSAWTFDGVMRRQVHRQSAFQGRSPAGPQLARPVGFGLGHRWAAWPAGAVGRVLPWSAVAVLLVVFFVWSPAGRQPAPPGKAPSAAVVPAENRLVLHGREWQAGDWPVPVTVGQGKVRSLSSVVQIEEMVVDLDGTPPPEKINSWRVAWAEEGERRQGLLTVIWARAGGDGPWQPVYTLLEQEVAGIQPWQLIPLPGEKGNLLLVAAPQPENSIQYQVLGYDGWQVSVHANLSEPGGTFWRQR